MIIYKDILETNREIKDHKKLCSLFNWEYTKGTNSRKAQLKELSRYCKWHKEGNKYYIDEIYDNPLKKIDGRENNKGNNNNVYSECIDKAILNNIVEFKSINTTLEFLFTEYIPLVDKKVYRSISYYWLDYSMSQHINKGVVMHYGIELYRKFKDILESSLNRLQKQDKIIWQYNYYIVIDYEEEVLANEEERQIIIDTEKDAYVALNIIPVQRKNKDVNKKFNEWVTNEIFSKKYIKGFIYYRKVISINKKSVNKRGNKLTKDEEYENNEALQNLLIEAISKKIRKIPYKPKKEEEEIFGDLDKEDRILQYPYQSDNNIKGMKKLELYLWCY